MVTFSIWSGDSLGDVQDVGTEQQMLAQIIGDKAL